MALQRKFEAGEFTIIAEMEPPKGVNVAATVTHAKRVKDRVSAFLVPEMSQAVMRMSALGAAMLLERDGMETVMQMCCRDRNRLVAVEIDDSIGRSASPEAEHERRVAIYDLVEENSFTLLSNPQGPYRLRLSTADGRLIFDVLSEAEERLTLIGLSMSPFRRIVKDYFMICESYYQAIRTATPSQIETIDMARRGLHNEGSELLRERLNGKVEVDFDTARRLFTLVCVLHWRG
jgi:uncharacterized protein (UPF0262 family)